IGLDPDEVLEDFLERHPDPEAPFLDPAPIPHVGPPAAASRAQSRVPPAIVLRLTLADTDAGFSAGRLLAGAGRRLGAVAWDIAVTLTLALLAFQILGLFWMPLAASVLAYYSLSILLLGNTPGVCLFARPHSQLPPARPRAAEDD